MNFLPRKSLLCSNAFMHLGIIDLGTNSMRFSAYRLDMEKQKVELLEKRKTMILPGQEVFLTGKIPGKSLRRILRSLKFYEKLAHQLHLDHFVGVATCALREARNSKSILNLMGEQSLLPIKVISGPREAELIAKGVLRVEGNLGKGSQLLIDIGGGSTELALVENHKVLKAVSLPLGSQRLQQLFPHLMDGAPTELRFEDLERLRSYITTKIRAGTRTWPKKSFRMAIGSSGTIKTLNRLIHRKKSSRQSRLAWIRQVHQIGLSKKDLQFGRSDLHRLNQSLLFLTHKQLLHLAGVEEQRRPLLVHGGILLEEILNHFAIDRIRCTEGALREGLVAEIIEGKLKPLKIVAQVNTKKSPRKKVSKKKSHKKKSPTDKTPP